MNRREFGMLIAGAAGAHAGNAIFNEAKRPKNEGVTTRFAHYIFDYENHEIGVSPERVPKQKFDAFVREGLSAKYIYNLQNPTIQQAQDQPTNSTYNSANAALLSTFEKCARDGTTILGTDIDVPHFEYEEEVLFNAKKIAAAIYIGKNAAKPIEKILSARSPGNNLPDRRTFLKAAAVTAANVFGLYATSDILSQVILANKDIDPDSDLYRSAERVFAYTTDLDPTNRAIFLRSLIWIYKADMYAENFYQKNKRRAEIYVQSGAGHKIIEDFAHLNKQTLQIMILAYPNITLQNIVNENDGIKTFASTLNLRIDPSFRWNKDPNAALKQQQKFHLSLSRDIDLELALKRKGIV